MSEDELFDHSRVCSRHFPNGNTSLLPSLHLGKQFASPVKAQTEHGKRAVKKRSTTPTCSILPSAKQQLTSSPREVTPVSDQSSEPFSTSIGEPFLSDYSVHELGLEAEEEPGSSEKGREFHDPFLDVMLTSQIEYLEAENQKLQNNVTSQREKLFRMEHIANNDSLITFYTGFISFEVLMLFFEFLGPVVNHLN